MNTHIDDHIAFDYPEDHLLQISTPGQSYNLAKGARHIFITLFDKCLWKLLKYQREHSAQIPDIKDSHPDAPTDRTFIEAYDNYRFSGAGIWYERISVSGRLIRRDLHLFVMRGSSHLEINISDAKAFSRHDVDALVSTLFFLGEEGYAERVRKGPRAQIADSPYIVELPHFAEHEKQRTAGPRYNVEFMGDEITDSQKRAVRTLVDNEAEIYHRVLVAVFHYYSQYIWPICARMGFSKEEMADLFPEVKDPSEMRANFGLVTIYVHETRADGIAPLALSCHCMWDPEHGLGIRLKGAQIEAVGTDEVAIFRDHHEKP